MKRQYIDLNGKIYLVKKYKNDVKLNLAHAYILKNDIVLPYMGDVQYFEKLKPGIYKDNDKIRMVYPVSKKKCELFNIKTAYSMDSAQDVYDLMQKKGVTKPEDIELLMAESDDIFNPAIDFKIDNLLQQIIKISLENKQIDINKYLPRFENTTDLNNEKRSLRNHGKMSFEKFIKWCRILDLDFEIKIKDSENSIHPMNKEIIKSLIRE